MKTNNLGYPRIGSNRELKKANELYWAGKISAENLLATGSTIRKENWLLQAENGIDLISNISKMGNLNTRFPLNLMQSLLDKINVTTT